jgi:hypothetical protein
MAANSADPRWPGTGNERSARGLKIIALSLAEHRMLAGLAASGLSRAEIAGQPA